MDGLLEMGTDGKAISNPHKCSESASIRKKPLNNQMDEIYCVHVSFFPQISWFLLSGPTYKVAMVAGIRGYS